MKRSIIALLAALFLTGSLASGALAQPRNDYPDITGIWEGSHPIGFARTHPTFPDAIVDFDTEIEIYRQEGELFWIANRWRISGETDWEEQYAVGAFLGDEDDEFVFSKMGGNDNPVALPGFFIGELDDGVMYLTYDGAGEGVAFTAVLQRRRN
ncbi:MAG: hypothetical protein AAF414_17900 [Pseudomonadota bacterium]